MTPEQIFDQFVHEVSHNCPSVNSEEDLGRYSEAVQAHYDRIVELRKSLLEAIPTDTPSWIYSSANAAYQLAVITAESWRAQSGS